ncbi:hypothetical protein MOK15_05630 [Sphingobium sp. BYY-5]|uniref:hypothetical protein n=1 Tax=Sphingobium sp. BYY-5 TaxID=2926400 RepID=UPI001FA768A7|nr:hypothetical protein [Sphingobium sp. BYY-5]MCI4589570.1 hypothetical protein [Sphingobium sp. BYY-5]
MPEFNPAAGQVVADELRDAFVSLDTSVHDSARLMTTFLEAMKGSDLAPSRSQRALRALAASLNKSVESRADMIDAQRVMVAIKRDSNLDIYDYGCWMFPAMESTQQASSVPTQVDA